MIQGTLSLVLPAHNEASNIAHVVTHALDQLPRFFRSYEIIIVNDGSSDETRAISDRLSAEHQSVRVIHHAHNRGYGGALISGFQASTGDWVMIMDADRQFDLGDLVYFYPFVNEFDMVAGYRLQRNDPPHRILFGKVFGLAVRTLFGLKLRDIDCAFKVMRGDLLRSLTLQSPGALISTELFARWLRAGGTWVEVGVHHYPRPAGEQSGGSLRVIFRAMKETLMLWYRLNREPVKNPSRKIVPNPPSTGLSLGTAAIIGTIIMTTIVLLLSKLGRREES